MSFLGCIPWSGNIKQLFILELLFVISVDMWQDQSNCGYQRAPLKPEPSIVGGQLAQHGEWPWIASLLEFDDPICGATLITPEWLLTAAHCIEIINDGSVYSVLMGTTDVIDVSQDTSQYKYIQEIYLHPKYGPDDTDWDIALIHLRGPMSMTNYVTTACLPNRDSEDKFFPGQAVTMAGWGTLYQGGRLTHQLREVTVPLVNHTLCREEYYPFPISDNMICTGHKQGGKDSCQGDSGGPTVTKVGDHWWLVGVIIGGVGCAAPGFRGVSSNTIAFQDWINPIFEGGVPERLVKTCESYEFTCQGGWCTPYFAKCDGFPDCRMGTDEAFCDGVLKLFDPFFYRRVANRTAAVIITNVRDIHVCARRCLDAEFTCGVFEYYQAGSMVDLNNQTRPVYDCLIAGLDTTMVELSTPQSKKIDFYQFVRKMNISGGDNFVFTSGTEVVLSPSYLPSGSFNFSSTTLFSSFSSPSLLSWTIRLSELIYNTIIFKMLATKGHIDCGNCSAFSLLSINGGGNLTSGKVGVARCLNEFIVGETFNVDSAEVFITYYATDLIDTGFMLEYNAKWLCNQSFNASPGSVSSPRFYLDNPVYPPNVQCYYSITTPSPNLVITLQLDSYIIEPDMEVGACDFDSLSIYDGNSTDAQRLEYLCGYSRSAVSLVSNSSSLLLVFMTDESGQYPGFAASYSFVDPNDGGDEADGADNRADEADGDDGDDNRADEADGADNRTDEADGDEGESSSYNSMSLKPDHDSEDLESIEESTYNESTSKPVSTISEEEKTTFSEETTTFFPINSHLKSTAMNLQYIFKITLVVFLLIFIILAVAFAVLYCRIKKENVQLKKNLQIHRKGNIVSL